MGNQSMRSWRTQIQKLQTSLWLGDAGRISAGLITRFWFFEDTQAKNHLDGFYSHKLSIFPVQLFFFWGGQAKMIKPRSRSWWIQAVNRETGRRVTGPGRSRRLFLMWCMGGGWENESKWCFSPRQLGKMSRGSGWKMENMFKLCMFSIVFCFFFPAHFFGEKQHGDITAIIYILRLRPTISRPGTLWSLIFWRHKTTRACTRSFMFESGMSIWAAFKAFKLC